jgi:CelD/BcsL family acetyltransferase involved in cellulose biosynthesis
MLAPTQNITIERRPLAGLADIVDPWRRLAERAAEPNVFYTPDFALAAAPALGRDVEAILAWSAERQLLGLVPFRLMSRRYGVKLPLLVGWTHPFAPLGTPLVERDATAEVAAACLAHIAGDASLPKLVLLPLLPDTGPVAGRCSPRAESSVVRIAHSESTSAPPSISPRGARATSRRRSAPSVCARRAACAAVSAR